MACIALQPWTPSICKYQDCSLCFTASSGKAVLELAGSIEGHPARILADTGAGLSIVSSSFTLKHQIPLKPTKTRFIHGVTGHRLAVSNLASVQVAVGDHHLGWLAAAVADTADFDLILGFSELQRLKPTIRWDTG